MEIQVNQNTQQLFKTEFLSDLEWSGYPVEDILFSIENRKGIKPNETDSTRTIRALRQWIPLTNEQVKEAFYKEDRDLLLPTIKSALEEILLPWRKSNTSEQLPSIQTLELARRLDVSVQTITGVLSRYPLSFALNGNVVTTQISKPEFPKDKLSLKTAGQFGVSPKRIIRQARFQSKRPGSKNVVKAAIRYQDIDAKIRAQAVNKGSIITFTENGIIETEVSTKKTSVSREIRDWNAFNDLGADPNKIPQLMDTLTFFEINEFKNRPLRARFALLKRLVELSQGQEIPVVIFNCFAFNWIPQEEKYPACQVFEDMDYSVSVYYRDRINQINQILSKIGTPRFYLIIADSETTDERLWDFAQPPEERQEITEKAQDELRKRLLESNIVSIKWSDFCKKYNLSSPYEYTSDGYQLITGDPNLRKKVMSELLEDKEYMEFYMSKSNVQSIPEDEFLDRLSWFYGMYIGEGIALQEAGAICINFERSASEWFQARTSEPIPILTPTQNIDAFYTWRKEQIRKKQPE